MQPHRLHRLKAGPAYFYIKEVERCIRRYALKLDANLILHDVLASEHRLQWNYIVSQN